MNLCKSFPMNLSSQSSIRRRLCTLLQSSHLFSSSFSSSSSIAEPEPEPVSESKDNNKKPFRFQIDPKLSPQKYIGNLDWPKPRKIPWQSNKTNSINLIGSVSVPIQFQDESPDGKSTVIAVLSHERTLLRIPIIFKGHLADIAAVHLREKDIIHVAGHLSGDSLPPKLVREHGHFGIQVTVHSISFVKQSFQGRQTGGTYTQAEPASCLSVNKLKDTLWRDLLDNPSQWVDNRKDKLDGLVKPKYPDFKRKNDGQPLWLNSAPKWAISQLQITSGKGGESSWGSGQQPAGSRRSNSKKTSKSLNNLSESSDKRADKRSGKLAVKAQGFIHKPKDESDESWKNLIENPNKWVDIRSEKINIKEPDFLHKDTGDALWLSNAPTWALGKLPPAKRL